MNPVEIDGRTVGKPAGVRCVQLTPDNRCKLFGSPDRPQVCVNLTPRPEMCGTTFEEAYIYLETLERVTRPDPLREQPGAPGSYSTG